MLVLAIDTSSPAVVAALAEVADGELRGLAVRDAISPRGHTELLTPSIADCLAEAGAVAGDLGAIVAGLGPGPFTGLRVGLVTAAALGDALNVPTYGVCSLDAIAGVFVADGWSVPATDEDRGPLLAVADARRKEVYWAAYRDGVRVDGPGVCRPDDLPPGRAAVGGGATLYAELLRARGVPVFTDHDYPQPWPLIRGALERISDAAPSETLVPIYLRRPDAVPGAGKRVSQ